MNTIVEEAGSDVHGHDHRIRIEVNTKAVTVVGEEQTGLSIKEAAIAQGVKIQLDFALSLERGGGKTEVIGDTDPVKVHPGEKFVAVDVDDNS